MAETATMDWGLFEEEKLMVLESRATPESEAMAEELGVRKVDAKHVVDGKKVGDVVWANAAYGATLQKIVKAPRIETIAIRGKQKGTKLPDCIGFEEVTIVLPSEEGIERSVKRIFENPDKGIEEQLLFEVKSESRNETEIYTVLDGAAGARIATEMFYSGETAAFDAALKDMEKPVVISSEKEAREAWNAMNAKVNEKRNAVSPEILADVAKGSAGGLTYQGKLTPALFDSENLRKLYDFLATSTDEKSGMDGFKAGSEIQKGQQNFILSTGYGFDIEAWASADLTNAKHRIETIVYYYTNWSGEGVADRLILIKEIDKKGKAKYYAVYDENDQYYEMMIGNKKAKGLPQKYEMTEEAFFEAVQGISNAEWIEEKEAVFWEAYNSLKENAK